MPDNILFFCTISSIFFRLFFGNMEYSIIAAIKTQREIDFITLYMV